MDISGSVLEEGRGFSAPVLEEKEWVSQVQQNPLGAIPRILRERGGVVQCALISLRLWLPSAPASPMPLFHN